MAVTTSLDRLKITLPSDILSENFKYNSHVRKLQKLDIGYYSVYSNTDTVQEVFHYCFRTTDTDKFIQDKCQELDRKKFRYIVKNNKKLYYRYSYLSPHYSYSIPIMKDIRITKVKSFLIIELNDVLQKYPKKSPYRILREVIETLIKLYIIEYRNRKKRTNKNIKQKCYRILKQLSLSEIEICSDINDLIAETIFKNLKHEKIVKYKNTKYFNNSFQNNKRWFFKMYNKSAKLRNSDNSKTGDTYRYEVTLGRNILNKYSRCFLKKSQKEIIKTLSKETNSALSAFKKCFQHNFLKIIIQYYNNTLSVNKRKIVNSLQILFYSLSI